MHNHHYRASFDEIVHFYDEVRPRYPSELFTTMDQKCGLLPHSKILEIAPGTGQVTSVLLEKAYEVVAVELSSEMSLTLNRKFAQNPLLEIRNGAFESVPIELNHYDMVVVATALHWIDEEEKFTKPHKILKGGGYFSIIHTFHFITDESRCFAKATEHIYKKYPCANENIPRCMPILPDEVTPDSLDSKLFDQIFFDVFPMICDYTTLDYIKLLQTTSEVATMNKTDRDDFLNQIQLVIDEQFSGKIRKEYGISLTIGKKI